MELHRKGSRPPVPGNEQWFTGTIRMEPIIGAEPPGRPGSAMVTFQPGARTNWHTHPLGQLLIITEGRGRAQTEGGPVVELHPGDVVWFPAGERHWHGAAPDAAMTHIAVQAALDGRTVDWGGPVTETEYAAPLAGKGTITLTGQLICTSMDEVEIVQKLLPEHIRLSREEPECLSFNVVQTENPMVWQLDETFRNRAAFEAHQTRTRASLWFKATAGLKRNYRINDD